MMGMPWAAISLPDGSVLMGAIALVLISFCLGALPFGLWIGRLGARIDIRQHGSGNLGATNVLRLLGPRLGITTLVLDVGKGWLAVALAPAWAGLGCVADGSPWPLLGGVAAVAGHILTPLAGFRGGKGVATSLGIFLALAPAAALLGVLGFVVCVWICRYVSVGSMTLAVIFPIATAFLGPPAPLRTYVVALGILLAGVLAWRHRINWARIAAGKETRFQWRSK
ncbi:MAG: glycerol-3-phosphate acyltransferase [Candidatus Eisenbacteria sp.]|nr:glycerol-3-phosphate acyltransferase [Candidatus Eisenbacteria bacterium]